MSKKIVVGADPGSVWLKDSVVKHLQSRGYGITDLGSTEAREVPYYEVGYNCGRAVSHGEFPLGVIFCGSGMGVSLVANKFKGVFAACCESVYSAKLSRAVNDANILSIGANFIAPHMAVKMVDAFLDARFLTDFPEGDPDFLAKAVETIRGYEKELLQSQT
jgi:sugar-phosphate isomerases, RpiB/LacA/LacB family